MLMIFCWRALNSLSSLRCAMLCSYITDGQPHLLLTGQTTVQPVACHTWCSCSEMAAPKCCTTYAEMLDICMLAAVQADMSQVRDRDAKGGWLGGLNPDVCVSGA